MAAVNNLSGLLISQTNQVTTHPHTYILQTHLCHITNNYFNLSVFAAKASKVVHLRNIPNESGESDVVALGIPFGRVTNVLVLKGKNQAFIEMADEISATSMVSCYTVNPPQMRGRMVYVQFSNHRELKTDQTHNVSET